MADNRLGTETSPYLLQHRDNPVAWRVWGQEALAEAAAADKPIMLSIGYAACHWCHVMAHESFENDAIAALINRWFVPIKVDREERPDLDALYQQALALMGEQGGWPLTMFLTPAGEPFWGGTYFPPESRWGRAGFPQVLETVARAYAERRDVVGRNVAALTDGLRRLARPSGGGALDEDVLDATARRLAGAIDPVHGGLGGAPKFPNCSVLEAIWRGYCRTGETALRDAVLLTLDKMSAGGIYDHLGGGYARYSTDERWLAPHFEKMLYDNAQLISLLTEAWRETGRPLYAERVAETIGWVLREMRAPSGGFSATIDADSEHEEGKFYVWRKDEIDRLLGADAALFDAHYDATPGGNWEGKTILNRSARPDPADATTEALLARCRATLFAAREARVRPGLDDKVLADWNGLMIAALAEASLAFGRTEWLEAAREAWRFVTTTMAAVPDRLDHSWRLGRRHPGTLDDYAQMSRAGLTLFEATGEAGYLAQVEGWIATLDAHFADPDDGAYFLAADDVGDLIARPKNAHDSAVPSGNGTMVEVLAKLHALTGDDAHASRAERLITAFSGELSRNPVALSALSCGARTLLHALSIVVIGMPQGPDTEALIAAAAAPSLPGRALLRLPPGRELRPNHPAHGKTTAGDGATAYVCAGRTCSAPITDPALLGSALRAARRRGSDDAAPAP